MENLIKKYFCLSAVVAALTLVSTSIAFAGQTLAGNKIDPRASLLITNVGVVNDLNDEYDFGYLIGEVGARYQRNENFGKNNYSLGTYITRIFNEADQDQRAYEEHMSQSPKPTSMGEATKSGKKMNVVIDLWNERIGSGTPVADIRNIEDLRGGPFRMLGIANRMDLALDRDPRNNNEITFDPRSLGELHLVYGVVNPRSNFEGKNNPFPMVFVISYRIPSINEKNGNLHILAEPTYDEFGWDWERIDDEGHLRKLDPAFELSDLYSPRQDGDLEAMWKKKMKIWSKRFAELSDNRNTSGKVSYNSAFKNSLREILDDIVKPENFLSIKSNTKVNDNEHELREWYTIASTNTRFLIHRKTRREPFRCMQDSKELAELIEHYWVDSGTANVPSYLENDLDMFTRDYDRGNSSAIQEFKAGYDVLRDNERRFLSSRVTGSATKDTLRWKSGTDSCGSTQNEMPYEMRPKQGSDDNKQKILMIPRFARVKNKGAIWKIKHLSGSNSFKERKRHAFAIRTCTGCHSQEGSTKGFHIFNRLSNQESQLSPYLIGNQGFLSDRRSNLVPSDITNTFSHGGASYTYDTLKTRENFMHDALRKDIRPYENLMRPEM